MDDEYLYVQAELKRRRRQLVTVANETGISRRTIGHILEDRDVRLSTLRALYDFLKTNARKSRL
jgi:DNA-binding phage protein